MSQKLNRFGRLVVAILKGDDAEATRVKIESKAIAAFNAQIAIKDAKTLDLEERVEEAKQNVDMSLVNDGNLISDRETYLTNYLIATEELEEAEEELKTHKEGLKKLKEGLSFIKEA